MLSEAAPLPRLQARPSPKPISQPLPAGAGDSGLKHPQRGWGTGPQCLCFWLRQQHQLGQEGRKSPGAKSKSSWERTGVGGREGLERAGRGVRFPAASPRGSERASRPAHHCQPPAREGRVVGPRHLERDVPGLLTESTL